MKPSILNVNALHVIQYPSGRFGFVGRVPTALAYENLDGSPINERQAAAAAHCGPGFAVPKIRKQTWTTREAAIVAAREAGHEVAE